MTLPLEMRTEMWSSDGLGYLTLWTLAQESVLGIIWAVLSVSHNNMLSMIRDLLLSYDRDKPSLSARMS